MIFIGYLLICISLSVVMSILTRKNNYKIKEMNEQIRAKAKRDKLIENWEKHHYRIRS